MTQLRLDLADIQGNILRGYRSPVARYLFYRFDAAAGGRAFVQAITDVLTTAVEWDGGMPESTVNIAFTHPGLVALQLPPDALEAFPADYRQGFLARARALGEVGPSDPSRWEPLWTSGAVHCFVMVGARSPAALQARVDWVESVRAASGDVVPVGAQDAGALVVDGKPSNKEHFGYSDGFGNPDIAGTGLPPQPGGGKPTPKGWQPVATGEFLLGHLNEAGEVAHAPPPIGLFRNGTFVAYRKLHQNVAAFRTYLAAEGDRYPGGREMLAAKMVGRWRDGTPLALSPAHPDPAIVADDARVINFTYGGDPEGARCPLGSHIRRANPRDGLGFGTLLTAGRRIMRRGLPYGQWTPEGQPVSDEAEHGVVFMALCASLQEQFEFVLQQWMNYGNDFFQGNDPDPVIGNRAASDKMVIPASPGTGGGSRPHVCFGLPQFVETRGGAYFFMPSLTALRWMTQDADPIKEELVAFDRTGAGDDTLPEPQQPAHPHQTLIARLEGAAAALGKDVLQVPREAAQLVERELGALHHETGALAEGLKAWAVAHPEAIFRVLRRVKPILTVKGVTLVTRFDDVQEVLQRDSVFVAPYADGFRELTGGRNFFLGMANTAEYQRDVSNMRIVVRRDDLPTRIAPFVGATADRLVAEAPGRMDVVSELAQRAATEFVADYFGIPSPTPTAFADQSGAISGYLFLAADNLRAGAVAASGAMLAAIRDTVAARKAGTARPDDVLGRCLVLQQAAVPGMDDDTLVVNLFGMVVGAIPTTAAMVARALDDLLDRPRELAMAHQAAVAGDTATVTRFVSEAMRFSPLGPGVPRNVVADYTIARGTTRAHEVKAGSKLLALLQSATFDGDRVESPHEFRTDRPDYEYMHFGYGMHTCFGQYINMVQIPRIAQALLARPNLRRAPGKDGTLQMAGPFPARMVLEFDPVPR